MNEIKKYLRHSALDHRSKIIPHPDHADNTAKNFLNFFKTSSDKNIALYMTNGSELDTYPLAELLWQKNIKTALPVISKGSKILSFREWKQTSKLEKNIFGIFEPIGEIDIDPAIIILPLLAFDQKGTRLGMGGGYYDATILDLKSKGHKFITVGYAYAEQAVLLALPGEDHDQSLDFVVTPQRVFDFRQDKV